MKKLLVSLLFASGLIACSTINQDVTPSKKHTTVVVVNGCDDVRELVKSNHQKVEQAFANNDANTIGTLELQNRAIVQSNMECFPKMKAAMDQWKKNHGDM